MGTISFSRYVRIVSSVIGASATRARELIIRLITSNPRVSPDEVLEFTSATDVGNFFGFSSPEYLRALFGFSWVSKNTTVMRKISFARAVPTSVAPSIYGADAGSLSSIVALGTNATLNMEVAGEPYVFQGINVSTALSYADVATAIQAVINADEDSPVMTTATVTYNATTSAFEFEGGTPVAGTISVGASSLASAIGWRSTDTLFISGALQRSTLESVLLADGISDNYCSLLVMDDTPLAEHAQIAQALNAISDTTYMYLVGCSAADAQSYYAALQNIPGIALGIVTDDPTDFNDMVPGVQAAAADYQNANATSNYMFSEFALPVSVSDDTLANQLDAVRANYIGQTQKAGRKFAFYQRGVLMGPPTAPVDQNIYVNEVWLKDTAAVAFMELLRALPELAANESGRTFGMATLQGVVDQALENGVISVGKELTTLQRAAVTVQSNNPDAWRQVQGNGYWMNVVVTQEVAESGVAEYTLDYLLIYAKKDTIRRVEGRHQLV